MVADADTEVLARAMKGSGIALSNDRYVDHRKLAGLHRARLVGWVVRGENVRLQERSLERLLSAVISARAQKQAFKELGIEEDAPELAFRWFCRNAACQQDLVAGPWLKHGDATCPACGAVLEKGKSWVLPIWVKVLNGPDEVIRFVLEDSEHVFVGRGQGDDVINIGVWGSESPEERHIELTNSGGSLLVRDNNTVQGTVLRRQVKGRPGKFQPPVRVPADRTELVSIGTKVVLGATPFAVQISGSRVL